MTEVVEVDPYDEVALRAFWECEQAAIRADREHPVIRTWDALRASVQSANPYQERVMVAVRDGGRTVGQGDLTMTSQDNLHVASVEVNVLPSHRRRGLGRALFDDLDRRRRAAGRTTVIGEVSVPPGAELGEVAPGAFALSLGFASASSEDHLVLTMPVEAEHVASLAVRADAAGSAYDVVVWGDRCPEEHVAAFCAMQTQMSRDVPMGDLELDPVVWDEERLRTSEQRTSVAYHRVVAAARRREDGVFGGYTLVFVPRGEDWGMQDDTLVMPEHRGHRLGTALKLATLEVLQRDHREVRALHTWTEPSNHAMQRTNADFGYRPVETLHEVQRKD